MQLDEVEEWIAHASRRYNRAAAILDPWAVRGFDAAAGRPRGTCEEFVFSGQSVGRLASTLLLLIRTGLWRCLMAGGHAGRRATKLVTLLRISTHGSFQEAWFRLGYAAMGANSTRAFKALGYVSCRVAW